MTTKQVGFKGVVPLAITAGATTPNPGVPGVWVWSTSAGAMLYWNGSSWTLPSGSSTPVFLNARVASVNNIATLSAPGPVDGMTLATGDVVLLKNQTTTTQNGWYVTGAGGGLTRVASLPTGTSVKAGFLTTVSEGTVNFNSIWMLTTTGAPVLDTNGLVFQTLDNAASGTAAAPSAGRSFMLMGA